MSADHCPACGKPWPEHPGIAATCVRLQSAREEVETLRAALREHGKESAKMQAELMGLKGVINVGNQTGLREQS